MRQRAAIALGSNLRSAWGDLAATLEEAVRRVSLLGRIERVSTFYKTVPVGYLDQPEFLNGALLLDTELTPHALLLALLEIEKAMGRDRSNALAKGPRVIDLDLLLLGDNLLRTAELTLPHPAMTQRRFVLEPLAEIAPNMRHPLLGITMTELLAQLPDKRIS